MAVPRVIFDFPVQPWNPGDPVIRDGIAEALGHDLSAFSAYGGDEEWRDEELARRLAATHDVLLLAGTPAFWDPNDRDMLRAALDAGLRIIIWGVGSGGGDGLWEGMTQDGELLRELACSPQLEALILRDETTHQTFRKAGARLGQVMSCPGLFAFGAPRLRNAKTHVALDLLDPHTLEKDGLFDAWRYYTAMRWLVEGLQARGANVALSCQRALRSTGTHKLLRAETWHDDDGRSLDAWLSIVGFAPGLRAGLTDFADARTMRAYYGARDVHIGARVHGALPSAGAGMAVLAMGIDMRRHTWLPASEAMTILPHQPPLWDVDAALDWYGRLDVESQSRRSIAFREDELRRTRAMLRNTSLAGFVAAVPPASLPARRMDDTMGNAWTSHNHMALIREPHPPRPPPFPLPLALSAAADAGPVPHAILAEARVLNWPASLGAGLRPPRILDLASGRSRAGLALLAGAGGAAVVATDHPTAARALGAARIVDKDDPGPWDAIVAVPSPRLYDALEAVLKQLGRLAPDGVLWLDGAQGPLRALLLRALPAPWLCRASAGYRPFLLVQRPQSAEPPALSAIIAMAEPRWVALLRLAEARAALLRDGADDAAITAAMQAAMAVMPGVADDAAAPLCSLYAAVLRCGDAALSAQAESHLRYALARMPDLPVPPELGPLQPADAIFTPGTVLHLRMRCEASANLLMLLERGCETGLPALTEPS